MSRRNIVWIGVVLAITLLFYALSPMSAGPAPVNRAYEPLVEVDGLVRQHYVEPVADDHLVEGAIRGMMRKLDPYSGYIGPGEIESYRRKTGGEFIGIGVEIGMHRGQITVIAPVEEGPAVQAGIRAGDVILMVDDVSTEDLTVFDVSELLRGPAGSDVRLSVLHRGQEEPESIVVTRGPVNVHGVKGVRLSGAGKWDFLLDRREGVAYVRVAHFQSDTLEQFDRAVREAREDGARGLILDLRFTPGGMLPPAIDMVDRFVSKGVIVSTVSRPGAHGAETEVYPAHAEDTLPPLSLVVLVNGATASAAEIVAGSLQAHRRALVVGSRTFGKGSVQHVMEVRGHSAAIRLTVAYYQLPNGRLIHRTPANAATDDWGVIPDLEVALSESETEAVQRRRQEVEGYSGFDGEGDRSAATRAAVQTDSPAVLIDRQLEQAIYALESLMMQGHD